MSSYPPADRRGNQRDQADRRGHGGPGDAPEARDTGDPRDERAAPDGPDARQARDLRAARERWEEHEVAPLWLRIGGDRRLAVIEAGGEIDIATVDLLAECAAGVLRHRPLRLTVDLSEITFFSVAGLRTLIRIREAAEADAVDFRLRSPSRMVRYVLQVAFPLEHFKVEREPVRRAKGRPGWHGTQGRIARFEE